MINSFYSEEELKDLGLKAFGENVFISKKCSIYSPYDISIGNNVRIDDFCILSGKITIGNYVHISAFNALYGKLGIEIGDFCGISPKCSLFSATDDFSGEFMISPMVPPNLTNVTGGMIKLNKYVQIGAGSIVLPKVELKEGSVAGAMTLIKEDLDEWSIYSGIPAIKLKSRKKNIINLAKEIK